MRTTLPLALSLALALAACGGGSGGSGGLSAGPGSLADTGSDGSAGSSDALPTTSGLDATSVTPTTADGPPATCGDGIVDAGEQCDDGADNGPAAACYPDCTANVCGDGIQSPGEACDLGQDNGPDHGCSADCALLPSACGHQIVGAALAPEPLDIIIVIDNSGSMIEEIQAVQDNINESFAQILEQNGLDYRVILVSKHGAVAQQNVCIEAPLSGIPQGGCVAPPAQPVHTDRFFHYSIKIDSHDAWCTLYGTLIGVQPDDFDVAPNGWQDWLRPGAFKNLIGLTDDDILCGSFNDGDTVESATAVAEFFDTAFRKEFPQHFGVTPETRNYRYYSIVGMQYNDPPDKPYGPLDPLVFATCPEGQNAGPGYQALSNLTGGIKLPLCNTASYDAVFQAVAASVVENVALACEFMVPEPPAGKTLDEDSVTVVFTPMGMGAPVVFDRVDAPDLCTPSAFYLAAGQVILCPEACAAVQGDEDATLEVEYTCEPLVPN